MIRRRTLLTSLALGALVGCQRSGGFRGEWLLFTTLLRVRVDAHSNAEAQSIATAVHDFLKRTGGDLYGYGDGELGRINRALAQGESIRVSQRLAALIRTASHWQSQSAGRFNPMSGALVIAWGMDDLTNAGEDSFARPTKQNIDRAVASSRGGVQFDDAGLLYAHTPAPVLDFGAIAKGVMLKELRAMLAALDYLRIVIDIGGDVSVAAADPQAHFRVAVADPTGGAAAVLRLNNGEAVMSSGDYARFRVIDGRRYQHIIDPRNGYPAAPAAATVISRDPIQADATATALVVGGPREFHEICDAMGVDKALLIDNLGNIVTTPGMDRRRISQHQ